MPASSQPPTPVAKEVLATAAAARLVFKIVPDGVKPTHDPNVAPLPSSTCRLSCPERAFVVATLARYSLTEPGSVPFDVTRMHFAPVEPGFIPDTAKAAAPASSSTRSTLPAAQEFAALFVVALNAA